MLAAYLWLKQGVQGGQFQPGLTVDSLVDHVGNV